MLQRFETFTMTFIHYNRYWNRIAAEEMKAFDLKAPHALYLVTILLRDGQLTVAALSEMCGRDKADVSRAVSTLEDRGMLIRTGQSSYRAHLQLTETGRMLAGKLSRRVNLAVETAGRGISEEERDAFYRVLEIISRNMKQMSENGMQQYACEGENE